MPWNGAGTFERTNGTHSGDTVWENDRDAGIKVVAENHDNHDQDLANGIQQCLTKDGQNTPTDNLPMGNNRHTGVGAAQAATDYARADQVQKGAFMWGGTAAGAADALTVNVAPALTAYTAGFVVRFIASDDSATTTPTLNVNAAGAKTIVDQNGDALVAGDIANGTEYEAIYDGTNFRVFKQAAVDLSGYVTGPETTTENKVPQWDSTTNALKDGLAVGEGASSLVQLDANANAFVAMPIGMPFPLFDHLTGVSAPSNAGTAKFIKLTAGLTGSGQYNEGLLTNESTSGTAPLVVATAEIATGPLSGKTINLINTENRYVKPGTSSGDVANDQMQQITGAITLRAGQEGVTPTGVFSESTAAAQQSTTTGASGTAVDFDSANSPDARTGTYTDVKHVQATYYMRIV
ncbi:hypothetical protein [Thalassospira marina]|uniref:Phage tail collar domain-containing protein n=1 Tax=Thalassospira marina TaxID=2048283 RepID=A0A2N3KY37_9PROT|nr:hypothetical protein [Thalassospira marina]PKR55396.1 hypothetical protein COO20_04295 [Thalassospira marina]